MSEIAGRAAIQIGATALQMTMVVEACFLAACLERLEEK